MEAKQMEGVISLVLGAYLAAVAFGLVPARKPAEANAAFLRKYRWLFLVAMAFLLIRGATYVAKLYW